MADSDLVSRARPGSMAVSSPGALGSLGGENAATGPGVLPRISVIRAEETTTGSREGIDQSSGEFAQVRQKGGWQLHHE